MVSNPGLFQIQVCLKSRFVSNLEKISDLDKSKIYLNLKPRKFLKSGFYPGKISGFSVIFLHGRALQSRVLVLGSSKKKQQKKDKTLK